MKPFSTYQHVEGEPMTERDKKEVGSKFWNEGKFDNFVAPFLHQTISPDRKHELNDLTFVDMGCNAGIFLKRTEGIGFGKVIGVDSDKGAIERAFRFRERNKGKYELRLANMETCLNNLPVADYTVLANAHYYFLIGDWLNYLDKLASKSRYIIIVTAEKRAQVSMAASDIPGIQTYFKNNWEQVGNVIEPSLEGDPYPRRLYGICFKSRLLDRVPLATLDNGNHVQDAFYSELDDGKHYSETKYYKIIKKYRLEDRKDWDEMKLNDFFIDRVELYENVKTNGVLNPLIVNSKNRVVDGNHRYQILNHLGHKTAIIRRVV